MSRPVSTYDVPTPNEQYLSQGYGSNSATADFAQGNPNESSPLADQMSVQPNATAFSEGESSALEDGPSGLDRAASTATTAVAPPAPSRRSTLSKRGSMRRTTSLKRSNSKKSLQAGSLAGHGGMESNHEYNSAFSTPIPTQGNPTEVLANRFQSWRQLLKSLISYFREIQASYDMRERATHKVQSAIANISNPVVFMRDGGINEATRILDEYHKRTAAESKKSREIEEDVINALNGLRSDLGQKIKEIRSLSSDFKNSVDKEKDGTRREVEKLQESIQHVEREDGSGLGKNDPYVVKLGVDRAVERQLDEENYLHRAYLNLESSGRELESIVVGEIQKAYNAIAGILKREGDDAHTAVDGLRSGPIAMPKDAEWNAFVEKDSHFVDPSLPLRKIEDIEYPGRDHPSAVEVRAGMLERKSKYLKSYTPGWYVLSPTHLHEFKSADKIYSQPPVMSLYLPDQKLGSQSQAGSSSHKFMVKGKQSGTMHKGHNWVFRAETYDTMQAWFEDMRILTEKSGEERDAFVRKHVRSNSAASRRLSMSSDGMEEDEADAVPYSAAASSLSREPEEEKPQRPQPGGRFPSDFQVQRARGVSTGQSSGSSAGRDEENVVVANPTPGASELSYAQPGQDPYRLDGVTAGTATVSSYDWESQQPSESYFGQTTVPATHTEGPASRDIGPLQGPEAPVQSVPVSPLGATSNEEWIAPAATGAVGAGIGAAALHNYEAETPQPVEPIPRPISPFTRDTAEVGSNASVKDAPFVDNTTVANNPAVVDNSYPVENSAVDAKVESAAAFNYGPAAVAAQPMVPHADNQMQGQQAVAYEHGDVGPPISRKETSMSISQLDVPGKYPGQV